MLLTANCSALQYHVNYYVIIELEVLTFVFDVCCPPIYFAFLQYGIAPFLLSVSLILELLIQVDELLMAAI